jgi:hypothetical protein
MTPTKPAEQHFAVSCTCGVVELFLMCAQDG